MKSFYPFFFLGLVLTASCSEEETKLNEEQLEESVTNEIPPESDSIQVLKLARELVEAIEEKDFLKIGKAVGKDGSVRFSPYGLVDSLQNSMSKMEFYSSPNIEMAWSNFEGCPRRIQLSVKDYFEEFVYDQDYANHKTIQVVYNRCIGSGNSVNNLQTFYNDHHFVEYYYPGTKENKGMDWSCLRLVFEKKDHTFLLVGIVHDQQST